MIHNWLQDRLESSLHIFQLAAIALIVRKMYSDFELQGVVEEKLNSRFYKTVMQRILMEEAAASVTNGLYQSEDLE